MKINLHKYENLNDDDLLNVFRKGFEVLDENSPFVSQELSVKWRGDVLWLVTPEFLGKSDTICSLHLTEEMLQFDSDHRKFNQLTAIEELIRLGILGSEF